MQVRWLTSPSESAWLSAALDHVARAEAEALAARNVFHIVLAGGNTPRLVYEALAREPHDWLRWHIWFGDERCLAAEDTERNSAMARAAFAGAPVNWHAIPAELGAHAAAAAYAQEIAAVAYFDLVLLGLGEDGHTASLFPGLVTDAAGDVVAVFDAPKPPPERVSLSAARLSRARRVLFLVSGATKREAVLRWQAGAPLPAAAIQPVAGVDVLLGPDFPISGVVT
jgi:6-phosphogluconolactonase